MQVTQKRNGLRSNVDLYCQTLNGTISLVIHDGQEVTELDLTDNQAEVVMSSLEDAVRCFRHFG